MGAGPSTTNPAAEAMLPPLVPSSAFNHLGQQPTPLRPQPVEYPMPPVSAQQAEQAAPTNPAGPLNPHGSRVTWDGGPGALPSGPAVDDWLLLFRDDPHDGAYDGKQLFATRSPAPPEGHGGYDVQGDYGVFIDRATQTQFIGWSDWASSTAAQAGGRGSFTGEHVVIARFAPGSYRGYQPNEMTSPNQDRNLPAPWDAAITIGQFLS